MYKLIGGYNSVQIKPQKHWHKQANAPFNLKSLPCGFLLNFYTRIIGRDFLQFFRSSYSGLDHFPFLLPVKMWQDKIFRSASITQMVLFESSVRA